MTKKLILKNPPDPVRTISANKTSTVKLLDFLTGESATILPNLGATVRELQLRSGNRIYSVLESPQSYSDTVKNRDFAGAKLIPFPGRIANSTYTFGKKTYRLEPRAGNKTAFHGFFYDRRFELLKTNVRKDRASVVLTSSHDGQTKGYPFKFDVRLTYTLSPGAFTCSTEIRNSDTKAFPVGDGWHPYFRTGGALKRLALIMPAHAVVEVDAGKIPTGKVQKTTSRSTRISLARARLDSVFDLGRTERRVTTRLQDRKQGIEIRLWQDSGTGRYRYLVVYRPSSGKSIAIEPWTCAPNAFNNGFGVIVLRPGGTYRASYGVTLKNLRD